MDGFAITSDLLNRWRSCIDKCCFVVGATPEAIASTGKIVQYRASLLGDNLTSVDVLEEMYLGDRLLCRLVRQGYQFRIEHFV